MSEQKGISLEMEAVFREMRGGDFRLCPRCRCCEEVREECEACGGEGHTPEGYLYEQDPLWYDEDDTEPCEICNGEGGWWRCGGNCDENGQHDGKFEEWLKAHSRKAKPVAEVSS